MPYSYNGWSASPNLPLRPLVVAGKAFSPGIRDDEDVYTVLKYVAEQVHERVERIDVGHPADDWGFSYRTNRNGSNLSNHASGTAIDFNATRHPNGVPTPRTFTPAQIVEIHRILDEVDNVVRWGGDYSGTPDSMHFEINANKAAVASVAARLRGKEDPMAQYDKQIGEILANTKKAVSQGEASKRRDVHLRDKILKPALREIFDCLADLAEGNEAALRRITKSKNEVLAAIDAAHNEEE